jgi:hypothetical protein
VDLNEEQANAKNEQAARHHLRYFKQLKRAEEAE